jgi:hypothetical protein
MGYTSQEIQARRKAGIVDRNLALEARQKAIREHQLSMMQSIKASGEAMDRMQKKIWKECNYP